MARKRKPDSITGRKGVYELKCLVNGMKYIGSGDLSVRRNSHKYFLRHGNHYNFFMQRDWDKYGEEKFQFNILQFCDNLNDPQIREKEYEYFQLNEGFLYNIAKGKDMWHVPEEYKKNSRNVHIYKFKFMAYLAGKILGTINDSVKEPQNPYTASYNKTFKVINEKSKAHTDQYIEDIYNMYQLGMSIRLIAKSTSLSDNTVSRVLQREFNINPMDKYKDVNGNNLKKVNDRVYLPLQQEWLNLFLNGMIINHIAKKYNVSECIITRYIQMKISNEEYLKIAKNNRIGSKLKYKHFIPEWEKLRKSGMSFHKIGKLYNVKGDTVATNLRGYDTRSIK